MLRYLNNIVVCDSCIFALIRSPGHTHVLANIKLYSPNRSLYQWTFKKICITTYTSTRMKLAIINTTIIN